MTEQVNLSSVHQQRCSFDDTFTESGADVGVDLSAVLDNKDSTAGNETVAFKYATTSTGTAATIDYQTTIIA